MHALEYMILQLSARIKQEIGNKALAEDAAALASATHYAFGETDDVAFRELYARWHEQHDDVMRRI